MGLEALLVPIAGFVRTLASNNGSTVTLPALELCLQEHMVNGTNRLSVVALGLVGTIVGSYIAVDFSDAILYAIVITGLLLVLGPLLVRPGH